MPKKNWKTPFEVGLDFTLVSILSVKEKLQVVTFYFWLYVIWTNEFLSWNPLDLCNISSIALPAKLLWVPDIFIDERADDDKYTPSPFINILSTGRIYFLQSYRLTSSCNLDVHAFPFDQQKCNLTVTASVYQAVAARTLRRPLVLVLPTSASSPPLQPGERSGLLLGPPGAAPGLFPGNGGERRRTNA
ncbi:5-hydroxytryptamine receptor 3A-like [Sceloporus undulatus]|uniref:5-hydroxytryptamine receptor 3A-like n=1 Tax=Sceloporus undulatus TaxID=8520 RepID=UPI001C4C9E2E|nr:5-hydroxytryptamine receptor 3A-like [Sceloporus undulatus]